MPKWSISRWEEADDPDGKTRQAFPPTPRVPARPMKPETEILRQCCRPEPDDTDAALLDALLSAVTDWDALIGLALRHGMVPLLHRHLSRRAWKGVPVTAAGSLKALNRENLIRNLAMLRELFRLLDSFSGGSVRVLPIKGPALAILAYGDLGSRTFHDLDLLIERDDLWPACHLMAAKGYLPEIELNNGNVGVYAAQEKCLTLNNSRTGLSVELQWSFVPGYFHCPYDFAALWKNRRSVSLENREIATLSDTETMRFLCLHGFKHGWDRLSLVGDLAHFLSRARPSPPENTRPSNAGLQLIERLVPGTISGEMTSELGRDVAARRMADQWQRDLSGGMPDDGRVFANGRMYVSGQRGIGCKILFLWRLLFTPTVEDWRYWKLKRFWRLHPVLRPARLAAHYILQGRA
jgi:hypothetical protein